MERVLVDTIDPGAPGVDTVETHVSTIALAGELAHKRKKPVRFAFVDQSTPALREALCAREVELNRRFSPDVYLGVEEVVDRAGNVVDHAVLMRRMPDDRRLSTIARSDADAVACVSAIADLVALRHAEADRGPAISSVATPEEIQALWDRNVDEMREFAPSILDDGQLDTVRDLSRRFIQGRRALFRERIDEGRIVDGHGDLLADDIYCLDDGPRLLDCLEFDDRLRWGDELLDVAFLAMDLEFLGRADLAAVLFDRYDACTADQHPLALEHFYIALRALVRAKVACLKGSPATVHDAREHLAHCVRHLREGRVRLAVVGGLPGTGKTSLSRAVGRRLGWRVLSSDEVRKSMAGLDPQTHCPSPYGAGLYDQATTERTYHELVDRAGWLLARGESVVIDASMSRVEWRRAVAEMASGHAADLVEIQCVVPTAVARQRLRRRNSSGVSASDADVQIAARMAEEFEPWPDATTVDTSHPLDQLAHTTAEWLRWARSATAVRGR